MKRWTKFAACGLAAGVYGSAAEQAVAQDWPQWGRDITKNMVAPDITGMPDDFSPGKFVGASDELDMSSARNVKWVAKLGSQSYGNVTVAGGLVYVGTNNETPRDKRSREDRSNLYCFREADGEFLWELSVPKLGAGKVSDWEYLGICSSAAVEGTRAYIITNQCDVVCLDSAGLADGNQGYQEEGQYVAGRGKEPVELLPTSADILWVFNMTDQCGVSPHNVTSSSPLLVGDQLWVATSNGVDYSHKDMPNPNAPALIVLDKNTGELLAEEQIGLGERTMHCGWSSPAYFKNDSHELAVFAASDGYCYGFAPTFVKDEDGYSLLQELWRCDINLAHYRMKDGKPVKYATRDGPSELISSPVVYEGKVYAVIGQDPEHGEGVGNLVCLDPTKTGDITATGQIWNYSKIHRTISTPSIADGLLYVADYSGYVYCLDANDGTEYWRHDTMGHIWGSTLLVDGKVYIGNEDGYLTILRAGKEKEKIREIDMQAPVYSSPVAANGVLYVGTQTHLFAFHQAPAEGQ